MLHYDSHIINGDELKIVLKDIKDEIFVTLITASATRNHSQDGTARKSRTGNITVESLQAGVWYLPHGKGYGCPT